MNTYFLHHSAHIARIALLALAAALATCSGCATSNHVDGRPIAQDKIDMIVKGQTSKDEIIEWFGAPASQSEMAGEVLYTYRYSQTKGSTAFMPYYTSGNSKTTSDELTITFDQASGKVKTYSVQRGIGA